MGDHGFDDGEDLLLLVAREGGDGFELAFELGLGAALVGKNAAAAGLEGRTLVIQTIERVVPR